MNLKILKKILLLFFETLKTNKDSELIGGIFNGISSLCEKVLENTEFTNDFSFTLDATSFSKKSKHKCC